MISIRTLARRATATIMVLATGALAHATFAYELNGFTREKGHGDVALSFTSEQYDHFWVGTTKVADPGVGKVKTKSYSLWFSYGVTDRLSIIATLPYVHADSDGLGGFDEKDYQDLTLLAQYRFVTGGSTVRSSLVGGFGIRTIASNYEPNQPVDVGDGTSDWLFRLVYMLQYRNFYFSQQGGYDERGGDAPNDTPYYTEIGHTWGQVTATGTYSVLKARHGTDIGDPGFTFPSNKEEWTRIGAKVYGRINDRFGLTASWYKTLEGRNTGDSHGVSVGVNYSFSSRN